jgi:hypothetical protein
MLWKASHWQRIEEKLDRVIEILEVTNRRLYEIEAFWVAWREMVRARPSQIKNPARVEAGKRAAESRRKKAAVKEMVLNGLDKPVIREQGEN